MDYTNWVRKTYPETDSLETGELQAEIEKIKSANELFREAVKLLAVLLIVLPFNVYLYVSGLHSFSLWGYWTAVALSLLVSGFVALYFEQKSIKYQLTKYFQKNLNFRKS